MADNSAFLLMFDRDEKKIIYMLPFSTFILAKTDTGRKETIFTKLRNQVGTKGRIVRLKEPGKRWKLI